MKLVAGTCPLVCADISPRVCRLFPSCVPTCPLVCADLSPRVCRLVPSCVPTFPLVCADLSPRVCRLVPSCVPPFPLVSADLSPSCVPTCPLVCADLSPSCVPTCPLVCADVFMRFYDTLQLDALYLGADLGGGCRRCAPLPPAKMTCGFLIQLVFCPKSQLRHSLLVHPS